MGKVKRNPLCLKSPLDINHFVNPFPVPGPVLCTGDAEMKEGRLADLALGCKQEVSINSEGSNRDLQSRGKCSRNC